MKIETWDRYHCYGMFVISVVYFFFPSVYPLLGYGLISFGILWIDNWKEIKHLSPPGGIANRVTLLRLVMLILVIAFASRLSNLTTAIMLAMVISLDGADGYLARKKNQQTAFGALFDMETDAFFACMVACLLVESGLAPWWIIIAGGMRYYYYVLTDLTGLSAIPEKRTRFGATIAVVLFISLILAFLLPEKLRILVLFIATVLLTGSFVYSFLRAIKIKLNKKIID